MHQFYTKMSTLWCIYLEKILCWHWDLNLWPSGLCLLARALPPIDHFVPVGIQCSGRPIRGHEDRYCCHCQHYPDPLYLLHQQPWATRNTIKLNKYYTLFVSLIFLFNFYFSLIFLNRRRNESGQTACVTKGQFLLLSRIFIGIQIIL